MSIGNDENIRASIYNHDSNRLAYLGMIQCIVNRMAGNSAIMKGFAATIIAAMLSMVATGTTAWYYYLISLIPLAGFIILDLFYLSMERKYRNLYALVADPSVHIRYNYTLSLKDSCLSDYSDRLKKKTDVKSLLKSISIWGYYPWFAILSIVIVLINIFG